MGLIVGGVLFLANDFQVDCCGWVFGFPVRVATAAPDTDEAAASPRLRAHPIPTLSSSKTRRLMGGLGPSISGNAETLLPW
jgi:hypothetical protein